MCLCLFIINYLMYIYLLWAQQPTEGQDLPPEYRCHVLLVTCFGTDHPATFKIPKAKKWSLPAVFDFLDQNFIYKTVVTNIFQIIPPSEYHIPW